MTIFRNKIILILITILSVVAAIIVVISMRQGSHTYSYKPDDTVKIIFDTDIDSDIDDMGALAVLYSYIRENRAVLLATVCSCNSGYAAPCIDAVNTWYGFPDIPVGVSPDCPSKGESVYQQYIAENYPNDIQRDEYAKPALSVYRECLATAEENSVVIVVVGPLNNLCDLLNSEGDEYSPLSGKELVARKVKLCVVMGGQFPESKPEGEYNIALAPDAAEEVSNECPISILWCGYEVGASIMTGSRIKEMSENNPVRIAYERYAEQNDDEQHGTFTRSSWDLTAVMYAVEGADIYWNERKGSALFLGIQGMANISEEIGKGYNRWRSNPEGKDAFLVSVLPDSYIASILDERMVTSERHN